ncbi:N-formylglutamate deformylase [uncultured Roseobacter sp.]|uniref:N-formylglutamate deformylase n=1 Tax=uncultured Roseobacter sp. TaxID=114847 RepID=UPI002635855F|nr:N-formylglutamate deformylase [uncultured Roseobacter sp.]
MPVDVTVGSSPLILAIPHAGTEIADPILQRLNEIGRRLADTDWHVDRLYSDLIDDVTTLRANFHRYVCDANRDPSGASLYPGQNSTGLVPLTSFDGEDIWDDPPNKVEMATWRSACHAPYHAALAAQIARLRAKHGFAVLYDCHSIRSKIPYLFEGTLPDFSIGTYMGASCDPEIAAQVTQVCKQAADYSTVVDGRFKGGWTTRKFGRPENNVHAIQMELAQSTYLTDEAAPWQYDAAKAAPLREILKDVLTYLKHWRPA